MVVLVGLKTWEGYSTVLLLLCFFFLFFFPSSSSFSPFPMGFNLQLRRDKDMNYPNFLFLLFLLLTLFSVTIITQAEAYEERGDSWVEKEGSFGPLENANDSGNDDSGSIWITISERGLAYIKDVLITQILQAITPLSLPDITKRMNVPSVGDVTTELTQISLHEVVVPQSAVSLGTSGITMAASDMRTNLTLHWKYSYRSFWFPVTLYDGGSADVQVAQMWASITVNLEEKDGGLVLVLLECGIHVEDLDIHLHGGTSWLYQWLVDAFQDRIRSTVEQQLTAQIMKGVQKLNYLLANLPRNVTVDELAVLDFSIVQDPIISPTTVSVGINGTFISQGFASFIRPGTSLQPGLLCSGNLKMVTIALSESLLNSAAAVYYNEDLLNQFADKLPDQTYLNTSKWKYLVPQLYRQYPNEEIKIEFEVKSPPVITVTPDGVQGLASANMILAVLDNNATISVACISIEVSLSGTADISENNITGHLEMQDVSLEQLWSHVGDLHLKLVKVIVSSLIKNAVMPILNLNLKKGFPLPIMSSIKLENSDVKYGNGNILICTDIRYEEIAIAWTRGFPLLVKS